MAFSRSDNKGVPSTGASGRGKGCDNASAAPRTGGPTTSSITRWSTLWLGRHVERLPARLVGAISRAGPTDHHDSAAMYDDDAVLRAGQSVPPAHVGRL